MTETAQARKLMVVVTRTYADKGSSNDEYVNEWGFLREKFDWGYSASDVVLLVMHGYKGSRLPEAISEALGELDAAPEDAWLFYHSLSTGDIDSISKAIESSPKGCQITGHFAYQSEGGTAVAGLMRIIEEELPDGVAPSAKETVRTAARGRRIFAEKLHSLRAGLLRLRILFDAYAIAHSKDAAGTADIAPVASRFAMEAEHLREGLGNVLDAITGTWSPTLGTAINRLEYLSGGNDQDAGVKERWQDWSKSTWLPKNVTGAPDIRSDFAYFARAVDVLISAFEAVHDPTTCPAGGVGSVGGKNDDD